MWRHAMTPMLLSLTATILHIDTGPLNALQHIQLGQDLLGMNASATAPALPCTAGVTQTSNLHGASR